LHDHHRIELKMQGSFGASFAMTARLRVVAEYQVEIFICGRTNAAWMALTLRVCVRRRRGVSCIRFDSQAGTSRNKIRGGHRLRVARSALESKGSLRSHGAGDECGPFRRSQRDIQRYSMEGKGRFIFPVLISALIVFVVSAVVTFTNIGLRGDFVPRWLKAFMTGWPVAAVLAFFAVPYVRRATDVIVRLIDG
jgi:hypothetical protein